MCKSDLEIKAVTQNIKLYFIIENSYFDISDFSENPVKKYLEPYYVVSSYNQSHYYMVSLSLNQILLDDNYAYSSGLKNLTSVNTHIDYSYD